MAKSKVEIPERVTDSYVEFLYEYYDETAAVAYQQLQLQYRAGCMARSLIPNCMRVIGVDEATPEEYFLGKHVQGVLGAPVN